MKFLSQKITGVQRVAHALLNELSKIENLKIIVLVPKNATIPSSYPSNVEFKIVGKKTGYMWEQFSLYHYLKKHNKPLLLNFCNIAPSRYKNSFLLLHDTTFKDKSNYVSKSWALRYRVLVRSYIYKVKKIFTVSNFTKKEIKRHYPKLKIDPIVVYNGYEHFKKIEEEQVGNLPETFYFSVGSLNKNKNFKYVLYLAKNNPDKSFVISGSPNTDYDDFLKSNNINNCIFTGYLSDGQLKYLYSRCDGFILPSFYEGFGLPPLEAISSGCKKLFLSSIEVFKEVYDGLATFFDPYDYDNTVNLDDGITINSSQLNKALEKYNWRKSSETIYNEVKNYLDNK